jgi:ADP-ribosylglycohydrolase
MGISMMTPSTNEAIPLYDRVLGCLIGGEIGDAMGAPAENKTYQEIEVQFGEITDFAGPGTDDSAIKHLLIDAIRRGDGYPTADDWAEAWLAQEDLFLRRHLFWIPVMNGFWKVRGEDVTPREAGCGNMSSSSSAMGISPMGIINAGDPRRAALETYDVASLIHHNFCRDAACAMAAAVAAALWPDATVEDVLSAARDYLPLRSASVMRGFIAETLTLARNCMAAAPENAYRLFRRRYYEERLLTGIAMPDARETVPVTLALFLLAGGDPARSVRYGANFGRDADTIASMAGALAGAFRGASAFPPDWVQKVQAGSPRDNWAVAAELVEVILRRVKEIEDRCAAVHRMHGG